MPRLLLRQYGRVSRDRSVTRSGGGQHRAPTDSVDPKSPRPTEPALRERPGHQRREAVEDHVSGPDDNGRRRVRATASTCHRRKWRGRRQGHLVLPSCHRH